MEKLQYRLENFEGPLDLLLNLVAKNKIDIYDIPIAELLEQYMEQIDLMREADMDVASEFLEMAARLVYIKTASLLPRQEDEEDPRMELTGILLEYRQCKAAAEKLRQMAAFNTVTRPPEELPAEARELFGPGVGEDSLGGQPDGVCAEKPLEAGEHSL